MEPKDVVERSKPSDLATVLVQSLRGSLGTTTEAAGPVLSEGPAVASAAALGGAKGEPWRLALSKQ